MHDILVEPEYNLLVQQKALMSCDDINLTFTDEAITEIAKLAVDLNRNVENIGARRLHTIIEKITEKISYECEPGDVTITAKEVQESIKPLFEKYDLSKYII